MKVGEARKCNKAMAREGRMIMDVLSNPYKSLRERMDTNGITVLVKESRRMWYRFETLSNTRFDILYGHRDLKRSGVAVEPPTPL